MSRPVRIEFPGASYHVSSKSREEQIVFVDDEDRGVFLNVLENVVNRFGWLIHSFALLSEHYDLVVEVPVGNLSKGMRQLNGVYTQHFNRRHDQEGPVFHGRFKSVLFEKKSYLLPLCRHVVTGPVRVEQHSNYSTYKWSSYRALAGQIKMPSYLYATDVWRHFAIRTKDAQRKYRDYVKQGIEAKSPLVERKNQVLLGSSKFLNEMQPILQGERLSKRGPKAVKRRRSLRMLFKKIDDMSRQERNILIKAAHLEYGYTLMEIGGHLGLHYTTVSKVINA